MFTNIYVPVDNSEYSNQAADLATRLAQLFGSKVVGCHVYAAAMHDYRFKQMEFTLPEEYLQEEEIERQRKIHDSLITMGLQLISDCYLNELDKKCKSLGLECERKMFDGKHHLEIVKDIDTSAYDLTVLGILGVGKTRDSQIGSVCERVTRTARKDVLVVKHVPKEGEKERDIILVGVDGSPQSFGGLITAIELAKKLNKKLEIISVYDPYLHYAVFKGIVDVLTDKAAKVFRFEEQNQLHEEIIDTGLAQIYQSHLNVAERMAQDRNVEVTKTLLDGKVFQKILNHARNNPPWLLVIGRVGVHNLKGENGLGSNTENLLRLCPCDILLSSRMEYPEIDKKAEESILWTAQAEERMSRVPNFVRGIARTAILRLAIEKGHSVITESVILEAMDRFMPKRAAHVTEKFAEKLAFEKVRNGEVSLCRKCGLTASEPNPVKCSVCGGTEFEKLSPSIIDQIAKSQGGLEEERTYDGRALGWSQEARRVLNAIEDKYQKRRVKARIEKAARMKKLNTITLEFAKRVVEEDIGPDLPFLETETNGHNGGNGKHAESVDPFEGVEPLQAYEPEEDLKVITRNEKGEELKSVFDWSDKAAQRILKIPSGFMRDKTQERTENIVLEEGSERIELAHVEAGLEIGRKMMEEFIKTSGLMEAEAPVNTATAQAEASIAAESKCPFSSYFPEDKQSQQNMKEAFENMLKGYEGNVESKIEKEVVSSKDTDLQPQKTVSHVYEGPVEKVLNETGVMHETHKRREELVR